MPMNFVILNRRVTLVGSMSLSCGQHGPAMLVTASECLCHVSHVKPTHLHFLLRHENDAVLSADTNAGHASRPNGLEGILCIPSYAKEGISKSSAGSANALS